MIKKTLIIGAATLTAAGLITTNRVQAYQGDPTVQGPNHTEEMEQIITDEDFESWKTAMLEKKEEHGGRMRVLEIIDTQEKFDQFTKAKQTEDTNEAKEILENLGLGSKAQDGSGQRNGKGQGQSKRNQSGNYLNQN
jgi:hypothetical protein